MPTDIAKYSIELFKPDAEIEEIRDRHADLRVARSFYRASVEQLIGAGNACSPTLNSLGSEFSLSPLIGKGLAVIADARFNGKNGSTVVERLLSISGEDAQTINRKYREAWTGRLSTRFHVISNELPQLPDASNALTGRFVILPTTRSWLHKEDHQLEGRFVPELPAF
jgi:putative DNA primase/helicase